VTSQIAKAIFIGMTIKKVFYVLNAEQHINNSTLASLLIAVALLEKYPWTRCICENALGI
jgi:hypothetical protein